MAIDWKTYKNDRQKLKDDLYRVIFGSDTPAGKKFDIILMWFIGVSVFVAIFGSTFTTNWLKVTATVLEYVFTFFFTAEYIIRIYCSPNPKKYIFSFFGIVDLLSILPPYLGFFFHSAKYAVVLRSLRLIRVFRVMKMFNFLNEGQMLIHSLIASSKKILVFFLFVVLLTICLGTIMFMVEGGHPGSSFNNLPNSIYWAIVTLTTVGYGDITPVTGMGRFISAVIMLMGYTIIAVPTGIVSASMISENRRQELRACPNCGAKYHDPGAKFCKNCGAKLENN